MGKSSKRYGDATAMAGEFLVMEKLYRLGCQPALTVGKAKSIDILAKTESGRIYEISVKSVRGGGKWGVPTDDLSSKAGLICVFLLYSDFEDLRREPDIFVIPAPDVERLKERWFEGSAVY
jgi:hypothetical protein